MPEAPVVTISVDELNAVLRGVVWLSAYYRGASGEAELPAGVASDLSKLYEWVGANGA